MVDSTLSKLILENQVKILIVFFQDSKFKEASLLLLTELYIFLFSKSINIDPYILY